MEIALEADRRVEGAGFAEVCEDGKGRGCVGEAELEGVTEGDSVMVTNDRNGMSEPH